MVTGPILVAVALALAFMLQRLVLVLAVPPGQVASQPQMRPAAWQSRLWRPLVAGATGMLAVAAMLIVVLRLDDTDALRAGLIACALITCCATDLLAYRVPDAVTFPATAFALLWSAIAGEPSLGAAVIAGLSCGCFLLVPAVLTRGGLGGGDVKLGVLIGVALGLPAAVYALGAGILIGALAVVALHLFRAVDRSQGLPFAPALALSGLAFLLLA